LSERVGDAGSGPGEGLEGSRRCSRMALAVEERKTESAHRRSALARIVEATDRGTDLTR